MTLKQLTRDEAQGSDDDVAGRHLEKPFPSSTSFSSEPDLLQDDILVEVDAVETESK